MGYSSLKREIDMEQLEIEEYIERLEKQTQYYTLGSGLYILDSGNLNRDFFIRNTILQPGQFITICSGVFVGEPWSS